MFQTLACGSRTNGRTNSGKAKMRQERPTYAPTSQRFTFQYGVKDFFVFIPSQVIFKFSTSTVEIQRRSLVIGSIDPLRRLHYYTLSYACFVHYPRRRCHTTLSTRSEPANIVLPPGAQQTNKTGQHCTTMWQYAAKVTQRNGCVGLDPTAFGPDSSGNKFGVINRIL